jgi:hypothetical protein
MHYDKGGRANRSTLPVAFAPLLPDVFDVHPVYPHFIVATNALMVIEQALCMTVAEA